MQCNRRKTLRLANAVVRCDYAGIFLRQETLCRRFPDISSEMPVLYEASYSGQLTWYRNALPEIHGRRQGYRLTLGSLNLYLPAQGEVAAGLSPATT